MTFNLLSHSNNNSSNNLLPKSKGNGTGALHINWGWGLAVFAGVQSLRRRRIADQPRLLKALVMASPLGFIAVEAGWTVTEVGRQPWIIYGVMRTADAVTPMPQLVVPFTVFTLLYVFLGVVVVVLLKNHVMAVTHERPAR